MSQVDELTQSEKTIASPDTDNSEEMDFSEFDALAGDDPNSVNNAGDTDRDPLDELLGDDEEEGSGNVQLDIDDAPFLDEEEEEEEKKEEAKEEEEGEKEEGETKKKGRFQFLANMSKKKKIIIAAALVLVILLIAAAAFFLLSGSPEAVDAEEVEEVKEEVAEGEEGSAGTYIVTVDESYKNPPVEITYDTKLEPFWVQMQDGGKTFFLVSTFTIHTKDEKLHQEVNRNIATLRDTIYYYLNTKNYDFLTNYKNFTLIKEDLLDEVNQKLGEGKLEDIYYDNYIVK